MTERRVILDAATFTDSRAALAVTGASTAGLREIVQRYLAACYEDLGKAPRLLDGEEVRVVLTELLPRRFGVKDPLAAAVAEVLGAYLAHLVETVVVTLAFEQRQALAAHVGDFEAAVVSGIAHADGVAAVGKSPTVVHRAAKVGRNDPCPCGSGQKFKRCCMRLGG